MSEIKAIYERIKYFKKVNTKTYQLLGYLGFIKEDVLKTNSGFWEIYTKTNFIFPYFVSEFNRPINKFCAIFKNSKEFIVYGTFENLEEIKEKLNLISKFFLKKEKKFAGIPFTLTEENAQDYGYIRGLILGSLLLIFDFSYPFIFKLKSGIMMGFIEYVKVIYYGTPGFGIFVGITGTGLYFIFLFILIPILLGWFYKRLAIKRNLKILNFFIQNISSYTYEFGINAEKTIEDEFSLIIEENKKLQIYNELKSYVSIDKKDFEEIYEKLKTGFLNISELNKFFEEYEKVFKNFPFKKFLDVVLKYENAKYFTEIKFQIDK
ncbi:MAG: hypothetical protein NC827_04615 [Candidatus Omnitrophica bacterium]|nr:hypothetical protein [Candidatus Omnitrophota bacterium]MCM8802575.1 hypothetical protein [Candidatus Omnitrophota bacterium]